MADLETFRAETRAWLDANAPASMREPWTSDDELFWGGRKQSHPPDVFLWAERCAAKGWLAPTWPKEYGGAGLSKEEDKILRQEMRILKIRPPMIGFGLDMIGPLILAEGTPEQKQEHLPKIASGEVRWCQGYSEPGSGSDLASLQTKAVADGDSYVINGQKVWTSFADRADWMFILVRTDPKAPKHAGITFLLLSMDSPGVSVKPIRLISGFSPFCETFLSDVRASRRNVIGKENDGWTIAKQLLGFERNMIAEIFTPPREEKKGVDPLSDLARFHAGEEDGKVADPILRDRLVQVAMDQICFQQTLTRSRDEAKAGERPGPETSIFKYYGTELNKRRYELQMSILGPQGTGWEGEGFAPAELRTTREWLRSRANSIEGGTSEIQLNIIAKRVLGLPD